MAMSLADLLRRAKQVTVGPYHRREIARRYPNRRRRGRQPACRTFEQIQQHRRDLPEPAILPPDPQPLCPRGRAASGDEQALAQHLRRLEVRQVGRAAKLQCDVHPKPPNRLELVVMLRPRLVGQRGYPRRAVVQPDGRGYLVAMLPPRPGRLVRVYLALPKQLRIVRRQIPVALIHAAMIPAPGGSR